jgi:periplasmic copper chaperone A
VRTITLPRPVSTDGGSFSTAVPEVTWSGGKILPGQFQDFSVAADPLPAGVSQLPFKAIQTYSNGDVVRWIDLQQPGQPAPDHPAPVLTLTTPDAVSGAPAASGGTGEATIALTLGAAGLVAGLLGLAMGLIGWLHGNPGRRAGGRHRDQQEGRVADHMSAPANGQQVHP